MSESQHKTRPARTRAKPGAAKAVAKDPAVQTAQAEQDAAALKAKAESDALAQGEAKPASDTAAQTAQAEQDAAALKAKAVSDALAQGEAMPASDAAAQAAQAEQDAAALKAKAESDALAQGEAMLASDAAVQTTQAEQEAIYILGAFTARAKSDAGFWRSGVQFHRLKETLVLVVEQEPDATAAVSAPDHEAELVVYLTAEKAERVHREPNLVIEDIDLEDLIDPAGVISPDSSE